MVSPEGREPIEVKTEKEFEQEVRFSKGLATGGSGAGRAGEEEKNFNWAVKEGNCWVEEGEVWRGLFLGGLRGLAGKQV